jgi:uncharacterized protein YhbP (UPF0306 family)
VKISRRSTDPEWEQRRTGQDEWYEILDARLLTDPPIPIPLPVPEQPRRESNTTDTAALVHRSDLILDRARFVTLATSGPGGPWASTVNYVALRRPLRMMWYSLRSAQHSVNLAAHPGVSGSLFLTGLTGADAPAGIPIDGAQFTGECREVTADELPEYHRNYYQSNFPDPAVREQWMLPLDEFRGNGPRRFYRLDIDRWWLYDAQRWTVDKHDSRVEVPVAAIDR